MIYYKKDGYVRICIKMFRICIKTFIEAFMEAFMTQTLTVKLNSNAADSAHPFSKKEVQGQYRPDLPKDLEELYGIFEGIDAPDKKELRKMFHEKNSY